MELDMTWNMAVFKIIIAGGRDFNDYPLLEKEVKKFIVEIANNRKFKRDDITIISGCADGADILGEKFAKKYGFKIDPYEAKWNELDHPKAWVKYRKDGTPYNAAAGPIRNEEMAKNATHCIVFWDGKSRGTKNMIENAQKYKLVLKIIHY